MWLEGWRLLALVVGLQGVILPFFRFGLLTASLASIRLGMQRRWTGIAFRWSEHLDLWSMPDVFLLGAAIGYSRVAVLIPVTIGIGGWSMIVAACLTMVARASLDQRSIWRMIHRPDPPLEGPRIACSSCDLVLPARHAGRRCPSCLARLWPRKPRAIERATALVLAGYPLYLVAKLVSDDSAGPVRQCQPADHLLWRADAAAGRLLAPGGHHLRRQHLHSDGEAAWA